MNRRVLPAVGQVFLCLALGSVSPSTSQPAEVTRLLQQGLRHLQYERYSAAINSLEEAWELDGADPMIAQNLAFAILNEHRPPTGAALSEAEALMRFSLENGGDAVVRVFHLHRGLRGFAKSEGSCFGHLKFGASGVHYLTEVSDDGFSVSPGDVEAFVFSERWQSVTSGAFGIETTGPKYRMRSIGRTEAEAQLVVRLGQEFLSSAGGN